MKRRSGRATRKFAFRKKIDVVEAQAKNIGAKFYWKVLAEQIVSVVNVGQEIQACLCVFRCLFRSVECFVEHD